jgi:hypothetical protein
MATKENNDNLQFYNQLREVPQHALKQISGGRLNGMSDINPVWRVKAMTEAFGPCGIGWKYEITKQWQEQYGNEVKSFTNINLYIKVNGEWSEPIPGTGGATLVENGRNGIYVNDEGHKMSLTDALSVAMKALGVAADIYFDKDKGHYDTKYEQQSYSSQQQQSWNQKPKQQSTSKPAQQQTQALFDTALSIIGDAKEEAYLIVKPEIESASSHDTLMAIWTNNAPLQDYAPFKMAMTKRKDELQNGKVK